MPDESRPRHRGEQLGSVEGEREASLTESSEGSGEEPLFSLFGECLRPKYIPFLSAYRANVVESSGGKDKRCNGAIPWKSAALCPARAGGPSPPCWDRRPGHRLRANAPA